MIPKIIHQTWKDEKLNKKTRKIRKIHFGASDYPQYRDSTPLKLYAYKDHKILPKVFKPNVGPKL